MNFINLCVKHSKVNLFQKKKKHLNIKMDYESLRISLSDETFKHLQQHLKRCQNKTYCCKNPCLKDSDYCSTHIIRDADNEAYKRCEFVYFNRKRCNNILHCKDDGIDLKILCDEHKIDDVIKPIPYAPEKTKDELLHQLSVVIADEPKVEEEIDVESIDDIVFSSYKNIKNLEDIKIEKDKADLDTIYAEPEDEKENYDFRDESCDSELGSSSSEDEGLEHAGFYTVEELVYLNLTKLKSMRKIYQIELVNLQRKLEQVRRRYLIESAAEAKITPEEFIKKNKCNNHKTDSWYLQQAHDKQKNKKEKNNTCSFFNGSIICTNNSVVFSKYCSQHILHDKRQVLFQACVAKTNGKQCDEPVLKINKSRLCNLHMKIQEECKTVNTAGHGRPRTVVTNLVKETISQERQNDQKANEEIQELISNLFCEIKDCF